MADGLQSWQEGGRERSGMGGREREGTGSWLTEWSCPRAGSPVLVTPLGAGLLSNPRPFMVEAPEEMELRDDSTRILLSRKGI